MKVPTLITLTIFKTLEAAGYAHGFAEVALKSGLDKAKSKIKQRKERR